MGATDLFPIFGVGDEHAGADDVLKGGAGLRERRADELEDCAGLFGCGEVVGAYGAGARDVDDVADAYCARETDDGLVRAGSGDILAIHVCQFIRWRRLDRAGAAHLSGITTSAWTR